MVLDLWTQIFSIYKYPSPGRKRRLVFTLVSETVNTGRDFSRVDDGCKDESVSEFVEAAQHLMTRPLYESHGEISTTGTWQIRPTLDSTAKHSSLMMLNMKNFLV